MRAAWVRPASVTPPVCRNTSRKRVPCVRARSAAMRSVSAATFCRLRDCWRSGLTSSLSFVAKVCEVRANLVISASISRSRLASIRTLSRRLSRCIFVAPAPCSLAPCASARTASCVPRAAGGARLGAALQCPQREGPFNRATAPVRSARAVRAGDCACPCAVAPPRCRGRCRCRC